MQPLVSIGMSVFNCEKTLRSAVQSILDQTYSNWELILIDDGSQDRTVEIAKSFQDDRIKVVTDGQNRQLPIRLNQTIALSRGKYFARMDGDDISYPERLQLQVDYLENHPEIDLLGTSHINFDGNGHATGVADRVLSHAEICARPWSGFSLLHPSWMGKLDWFRNCQYRPDAIRMEDYDLMLRTYQTSRFAALPDILLGYRVGTLSLKKILSSRYNLGITLGNKAIAERNVMFAYSVLEQIAKSLVETFAVVTGLGVKLLRHRIGRPLQAAELDRWTQIWERCNSDSLPVRR
jgi:glycosyltransferase involved in cell wall biosynthesis